MLFQINSMWQILGWVLVFAGLIITNEIERRTKKGGIFSLNSFSSANCLLYSYSDWCTHRSSLGIKQPDL